MADIIQVQLSLSSDNFGEYDRDYKIVNDSGKQVGKLYKLKETRIVKFKDEHSDYTGSIDIDPLYTILDRAVPTGFLFIFPDSKDEIFLTLASASCEEWLVDIRHGECVFETGDALPSNSYPIPVWAMERVVELALEQGKL